MRGIVLHMSTGRINRTLRVGSGPERCNPGEALEASLAALAVDQSRFCALFGTYPRAWNISVAFASYLTNTIPFANQRAGNVARRVVDPVVSASLLTTCLHNGIEVWDARSRSLSDFLFGLFFHIPRIAAWQAYSTRGRSSDTWDFCSGPLQDWMDRHCASPFVVPRPTIVSPPLSDQSIRTVVAVRTLEPDDYALLNFSLDPLLRERRPA